MASMVRPSLMMQADFDERVFSANAAGEMCRVFSYICPSSVSSHPSDDRYICNRLQCRIKLRRPYWNKNDGVAEELWQSVMPKWLRNMVNKISSTLTASRKVHLRQEKFGLDYHWIEFKFDDNMTIDFKSDVDFGLPPRALSDIDLVRVLACSDTFGQNAIRVHIPSPASYEIQLRTVEQAAAQGVEATEAAESIDAVADADDDIASDTASETTEPAFLEAACFDIDYTVWGIEYADGIIREFDSDNRIFLS